MQAIKRIIRKNALLALVAFTLAAGIGFAGTQALSQSSSSVRTECEAEVTCVDLYDTGAIPYSVTVEAGKAVQFNAKGNATYHLATAEDEHGSLHDHHGDEPKAHVSSGDFSGTEAWRVTFKEPGTYQFVDENNPEITVLVVAYRPGADYSIE